MKLILIFILMLSTVVISSCKESSPPTTSPVFSVIKESENNRATGDTSQLAKHKEADNTPTYDATRLEEVAVKAEATPAPHMAPSVKSISETAAEVKQPIERKIIRNGDFTIESKNPSEDQRKIASIAESLGGFVVTSEYKQAASSDSSGSSVNVVVRVPSAQFDKAINEIIKTGSQIIYQKTSGKDVTEEFVDLEARLRAKHALENQYLEIMKRASKISDVLEVQEKLTDVRTEIEQMEGRRRYLDNQASLSTINITLQSPAAIVAATQNGFWRSIKNSFGDGIDEAVGIVLGVIHFVIVALPIFVLLILPSWFILRFLNRRYNFMNRWKKEHVVAATKE